MVSYTVNIKTGTQPDVVNVIEAKAHLNITHSYQDDLIQTYINTAIAEAENYTTRSLKNYEVEIKTGQFQNGLVLQYGPVKAKPVITYLDASKAPQTLDATAYELMTINGEPTLIYLDESTLPSIYSQLNAVTITYDTGYATNAVPVEFKQFVKLLVGTMYDNRTDTVDKLPRLSYSLIRKHRAW